MRSFVTQTDFLGPFDFGYEPDPKRILLIFLWHRHVTTRNACLSALKEGTAGKASDGHRSFDSRFANAHTYNMFEETISGLYKLKEKVQDSGVWSAEKLEDWYEQAIETLMEAYLRVAIIGQNSPQQFALEKPHLERPLKFLLTLIKKGRSPTGPGKDFKHILYYASAYFGHESKPEHLDGMEKYLSSQLSRFLENLQKKKVELQDWEPIKKLLEFIIDKAYYKKSLVKPINQLKGFLEMRLENKSDRSLRAAHDLILYQQVLSLINFILADPSLQPKR